MPPDIGDFARMVLVCAVYRLILLTHQSIRSVIFPRPDLRESSIRALNRGAANLLEVLVPRPLALSEADGVLRSRVEIYSLMALTLFYAPRKDIVDYAACLADGNVPRAEEDKLRAWMERDGGSDARTAVSYASCLLTTLRRSPSPGFHEPIATLWAVLVLWTFNRLTVAARSGNPAGVAEVEAGLSSRPADLDHGQQLRECARWSTVRLDMYWASRDLKAWHAGKDMLRPHVKDIGNICLPTAGRRILDVGIALLSRMRACTFSGDLTSWLQALGLRSEMFPA